MKFTERHLIAIQNPCARAYEAANHIFRAEHKGGALSLLTINK